MRILVTGASGFLGRYVLSILCNSGHQVIAMTRNTPIKTPLASEFELVTMDMADVNGKTFKRLGCPDLLIHLAWGGLPNYQSNHHIEQEAPRAFHFIETLIQSGLGSIAVAGTCAEYGSLGGELTENQTGSEQNKYARAKLTLLNKLVDLQQDQPFTLTWMRMFYMYGKGQSEHSLLSQLIAAALRGDPVFNMSGGLQMKDYLPVSAVAKYIVDLSLLRADIGVVNVCSGKTTRILDLVKEFVTANNLKISLNTGYYPYPDNEAMSSWGSTKKLLSFVEPCREPALSDLTVTNSQIDCDQVQYL